MKKPDKSALIRFILMIFVFMALFAPIHSAYAQKKGLEELAPFPSQAKNPGWLGVGLRPMDAEEKEKAGVDYRGVIIRQVFDNTPAKSSGFEVGDHVISIENNEIKRGVRELVAHVKSHKEGSRISFKINRDGKDKILTVVLGKVPRRGEIIENAWLNKEILDVSVVDIDGDKNIQLDNLKGNILVIDYWATWCNPCKKAIPILDELQSLYRDKNVIVIGVSDEKPDVIRTYAKNRPVEYRIAYDQDRKMGGTFYISSYPTFMVIDKKSVVRYISTGLNGARELRSIVDKILAEDVN